jgi:hypothetical protein
MSNYIIKPFEPAFEEEQDKLELGNKQSWYGIALKSYFSDPEFDSETILSCFKDNEMVGFLKSRFIKEGSAIMIHERPAAYIQFPSIIPGHGKVIDLLLDQIIEFYAKKGVKYIQMQASTMWEYSIETAKKYGFKPLKDFQLGYKKYYNYKLVNGTPEFPINNVQPFEKERDLSECIETVSDFFGMSRKSANNWIVGLETHEDLISHLIMRKEGKLAGYCYTLLNSFDPTIAATYYIDAINEDYFKQLIVKTIDDCIQKQCKFFLIDLLKNLLLYEDAVKSLGLTLAAQFGIYEKTMNPPH